MVIDHIALYVKNLEEMRIFYEKYFDAKSNQKYHNIKTGLETYFLSFDNKARLEIMTRPGMVSAPQDGFPLGYTHLAFQLGSKEKVDTLTKQLQSDGYSVVSGPRTTGDGYYESCVLDPEGNQIELVA